MTVSIADVDTVERETVEMYVESERGVGTGWQRFETVLAGGDGVLYAIKTNGDLLYYHHSANPTATGQFTKPIKIGAGWQIFRWVVAGGDNILYACTHDNALHYYQHHSEPKGEGEFADPVKISDSWHQSCYVVAGHDRVLYVIT